MKDFVLQKNDIVVFSARVIPGNETEIAYIKNSLLKFGVKIIDTNNYSETIHVSGHPAQPEILLLTKSVNPRFVVPVHGEYMHLNKIKEALLRLSNSWMSRLKNALKFLLAQKRKTELFR